MSAASSTTTNTAGTKRPAPRTPKPSQVYTGQTFRKLRLIAGERPFAVVSVDTDADTASGWVFPDPRLDAEDPLLREAGVQAADRRKPCYITVPTDWLK